MSQDRNVYLVLIVTVEYLAIGSLAMKFSQDK
jgi:hypothetical protein